MFLIFFFVVFFIYIGNYLFPKIIEKQKLEKKIFRTLTNNGINNIICFENYWMTINRNIFSLDINFFKKDDKVVTCDVKLPESNPLAGFVKQDCKYGSYNDINSVCFTLLTSILSTLN